MAYSLSVKEKALKLRRTGRSLSEITRQINVSKSTVSAWVGGVALNAAGKKRLLKKVKLGQIEFAKKLESEPLLARRYISKKLESSWWSILTIIK